MISLPIVRKLAFAFDDVHEQPHFEKISFRVKNKIFATVDVKAKVVVLKLSEIDQSVFSDYHPAAIYPVPGAWGKQGWTKFEMTSVRKDLFKDALTTSYCNVAPPKLALKYRLM
jgi:predicted DNA-binding protein (MmcQ/YjbR family)